MLKKSEIYSDLKKVAQDVKDENVLDVFLFGSFAKGKSRPTDIDICMVFLNNIDNSKVDEFYLKCDELEINVHVSSLVAENFFTKTHSLITTILFEGVSLLDDKPASGRYGMKSWTLYSYNISHMEPSEKVRFVHTMKGRGEDKGIVEEYGGYFISAGSFLIPVNKDNEIKDVFDHWKIKYIRKPLLLIS